MRALPGTGRRTGSVMAPSLDPSTTPRNPCRPAAGNARRHVPHNSLTTFSCCSSSLDSPQRSGRGGTGRTCRVTRRYRATASAGSGPAEPRARCGRDQWAAVKASRTSAGMRPAVGDSAPVAACPVADGRGLCTVGAGAATVGAGRAGATGGSVGVVQPGREILAQGGGMGGGEIDLVGHSVEAKGDRLLGGLIVTEPGLHPAAYPRH